MANKFRLVTRSDFDGLVCAILLNELDMIDDIKFVHPKDMQDGKIEITEKDIVTNLPYAPLAHLVFDHHASEELRVQGKLENRVIDASAPSAARVVFDYFGGKEKFESISDEMMEAVDKADSAQFSEDEILNPRDWVMLNYLMDPRTGLGRFREFRISNYTLMMDLISYCRNHTITEILNLPDVYERIEIYREHAPKAREQILRCARVYDKLVVLDLREEEMIWATNRFMIYALFPGTNISIHVMWGMQKQNTVLACGKSIIDRSSRTDIGELMLQYGGGGHHAAGTCQLPNETAYETLQVLIEKIRLTT